MTDTDPTPSDNTDEEPTEPTLEHSQATLQAALAELIEGALLDLTGFTMRIHRLVIVLQVLNQKPINKAEAARLTTQIIDFWNTAGDFLRSTIDQQVSDTAATIIGEFITRGATVAHPAIEKASRDAIRRGRQMKVAGNDQPTDTPTGGGS